MLCALTYTVLYISMKLTKNRTRMGTGGPMAALKFPRRCHRVDMVRAEPRV